MQAVAPTGNAHHHTPSVSAGSEIRPFAALVLLLTLTYTGWLCVFWPGILGEDSVAILLEAQDPDAFRSGKTVFWYYFVKLFYLGTHRVEVPIAIILLVSAVVFARILAWCWTQQLRKTFIFSLLFIALAPHMIYFMGTLYPDGIFAVASTGLLFELWLIARLRTATKASVLMIALTLPFAAFARPNGILFLLPAVLVLPLVNTRSRRLLLMVMGAWCLVMIVGTRLHKASSQESIFPLALFETVHFLRPHAMNDLWATYPKMNDPWVLTAPRVSLRTIELLQSHRSLQNIQAYSDPAYWDMLIFHPQGPQLGRLPEESKRALVHEFFTYNLWHNLPDFIASRVSVFFTSVMAQGGFPAFSYATQVLPRTQAASTYRRFHWDKAELTLLKVHRASHAGRWLLWAPWLGIGLLICALHRGIKSRDTPLLLIAAPMMVQLVAIFLLSTAGEYRYLLLFFTLPLVLLPALTVQRQSPLRPAQKSTSKTGTPYPFL